MPTTLETNRGSFQHSFTNDLLLAILWSTQVHTLSIVFLVCSNLSIDSPMSLEW